MEATTRQIFLQIFKSIKKTWFLGTLFFMSCFNTYENENRDFQADIDSFVSILNDTILGKRDFVIEKTSQLIKKNSSCGECYLFRAFAKEDLSLENEAIQDYSYIINNKDSLSFEYTSLSVDTILSIAHKNRSTLYFKNEEYIKSIYDSETHLKFKGDNIHDLNNIGALQMKLGRPSIALAYLKLAYKIDSLHFNVLLNISQVYLNIDSLVLAKKYINSALKQKYDYEAFYTRALINSEQRNIDEAEEDFQRCFKLNNTDPEIYKAYALLKLSLKDTSAFCKNIKTALELNGRFDEKQISEICYKYP
ncbi:MAG: hypothetical protein WD048_11045 [Chitinophagales bacterium]